MKMSTQRHRHYFSTREILVIAALAAMGGATGVFLGYAGSVLRTMTGFPGGLQWLAGLHVLWPALAALLIGRAGAASATGVLKGTVELLSGNPHGLIVLAVSAVAGVLIDATFAITPSRARPVAVIIGSAIASASNVPVFQFFASLPAHRIVISALTLLMCVAGVSGAVLGGALSLALAATLRRAGLVPGQSVSGLRR